MKKNVPLLIERLRRNDPRAFDNALDELRENIQASKKRIYDAAVDEQDPHVKGALIELLGESRDTAYVPYISRQLKSKEPEVVFWSYVSLTRIGTDQALILPNIREIKAALEDKRKKD